MLLELLLLLKFFNNQGVLFCCWLIYSRDDCAGVVAAAFFLNQLSRLISILVLHFISTNVQFILQLRLQRSIA
jgi:hypothetical protein